MARCKKNARRRRAWIFFQDESGVSQRPSIRRTWAPKGETPVLIHAFNWSSLSVCAALGYRWDGRRNRLFFQTRVGAYNSESLVAFLKDLKRHLHGAKAILIWDGLPSHKSLVMTDFLDSQRSWLKVERQGYGKVGRSRNPWARASTDFVPSACNGERNRQNGLPQIPVCTNFRHGAGESSSFLSGCEKGS